MTCTPGVDSLAAATLGVMTGASLAVAMVGGQAPAQARGLVTKHAIKQVDRLLRQRWHQCLGELRPLGAASAGSRGDVVVAMDWTDSTATAR